MIRTVLFASLCCLLIAGPAVASDDKAVSLKPGTPWNVDFGEHTCRLARIFGDGEQKHILFIEQAWPGEVFGLTAAGPQFERFQNSRFVKLRFADNVPEQETSPFKGSVDDIGPALIYPSARLVKYEKGRGGSAFSERRISGPAAEAAQFVGFEQSGRSVRFETGPLKDALAVADTCARDLVRSWGLDLERHMTSRSMPRWTNRERVVRRIGRLYPSSALRLGEQAIVRMRVMVDENGAVTDCHIVEATDTERLESPA